MTNRERLIKLLDDVIYNSLPKHSKGENVVEDIADYLLSNGVVVINTDVVSDKNRPLISRIAGYPIDEIISLMQAKAEGKIIVPPCKVGQKIYILISSTKEIDECEVSGLVIQTKHDVIKFKDGSIYTIWDKDYGAHFGKTIFLTKEEAEKALKEREENVREK